MRLPVRSPIEARAERPSPESLRAEWEAEVAVRLDAAEAKGREEGRREAVAAAESSARREQRRAEKEKLRIEILAERTRGLVEELVRAHSEQMEGLQHETAKRIGAISVELAARIVRWVVELDPDVAGRVLAECIDAVDPDTERVRVRLHPKDAAHLRKAEVESLGTIALQLVGDAEIERGGCLVEAGETTIDARIGRQLDRVGEALAKALQEDSNERVAEADCDIEAEAVEQRDAGDSERSSTSVDSGPARAEEGRSQ
ncbi:MAG: hypothetical protein CME06_03600 [Gemmatimonadetes bacterium]|nr:hypothetical protein [Gemmatimonadota bacterium]